MSPAFLAVMLCLQHFQQPHISPRLGTAAPQPPAPQFLHPSSCPCCSACSLSSSPTSVPKHLQHHNSPFLSASTGGKANNAVDALTRGGSDAGPRGSSSWATWAFPASSAGSMGQAGLERKGNVSPVDGLLSGPEGGSNRGLDGNSPAGVSLSDNSASALLGEDRGHEGRGGGLSAAQRLLEQSGVSSSNARTGCCEGGMHRFCPWVRHEFAWARRSSSVHWYA
eukprot:1158786-Pelagomonas_calceolata.AAC.7